MKGKGKNVVTFPGKQVPPPDLPLTGVAFDKYTELARMLLKSGALNVYTKGKCESLGLTHAEIQRRVEFGRSVPFSLIEKWDRGLEALQIAEGDSASSPAESNRPNRFATVGAIIRRGAKKAEVRAS